MNRWERTRRLLWASLLVAALPAAAQMQRPMPATAFRGEITFTQPPVITLNGEPDRLGPGARVRNAGNFFVLPSELIGQTFTVNYTRDLGKQVLDVWILTPAEIALQPNPEKVVSTTINLGPLGSYTFGNAPPPGPTHYDQLPRFPNKQ